MDELTLAGCYGSLVLGSGSGVFEVKYDLTYLKLARLCVKRKGIKDHGTDEGYVGCLAVVYSFLGIHPQTCQLGQHFYCLESLEVVDEDVGHPELLDKLKVHGDHD